MMREVLKRRGNWQRVANYLAEKGEASVFDILKVYLEGDSDYKVVKQPRDLKGVYGRNRGVVPDISIKNEKTSKQIFIEAKRQNDRGNAHERACKYFAPGLIERAAKIADVKMPFFFIFMNGIIDGEGSEKYHDEIKTWFDSKSYPNLKNHVLLWENRNTKKLCDFFDQSMYPLLQSG